MQFGPKSSLQYHLLPLCETLWFCASKKYKQISLKGSINKRNQQQKEISANFRHLIYWASVSKQGSLMLSRGQCLENCPHCDSQKDYFCWIIGLIGSCFWLKDCPLVSFWLVGLGLVWPAKTPVYVANSSQAYLEFFPSICCCLVI
jgi:hypothetical protein